MVFVCVGGNTRCGKLMSTLRIPRSLRTPAFCVFTVILGSVFVVDKTRISFTCGFALDFTYSVTLCTLGFYILRGLFTYLEFYVHCGFTYTGIVHTPGL